MPVLSLRVIIVNWNSGRQLSSCLHSIATVARVDRIQLEAVVVVDNASTDGSGDNLEAVFVTYQEKMPLLVLRNATNRGFAAGCNQGARGSKADYLLFLNPDTEAFEQSLEAPILFLERPENAGIGILGVQLLEEGGQVARSCSRFPTAWSYIGKGLALDRVFPHRFPPHFLVEWDHQSSREVDQVMGAFFLVRRSVYDLLNGFDERFFVYAEDMDFALRAKRQGYSSFYWNGAALFHRGRGTTEQVKARRLAYSLHSRLLYCFKHFAPVSAWLVVGSTLILEFLTRLMLALLRGSLGQAGEVIQGYGLLWLRLLQRNVRG